MRRHRRNTRLREDSKSFDRVGFAIDNPNNLRGQAKSFRLEVLQADVQWHVEHRGNLYGIVLPSVADDPNNNLHCEKVMERPKVVYNR